MFGRVNRSLIFMVIVALTCLLTITGNSKADKGVSVEGGVGLLNMNSAKTIGAGHYLVGIQWLSMKKDHTVLWKNKQFDRTDYPSIVGFPVIFGVTDNFDLSAAAYVFHDARELKVRSRVFEYYGKPTSGSGVTRVTAKYKLPQFISVDFHMAIKGGVSFDTADDNLEGINYRWVRDATDFDFSFNETFDLYGNINLHLEEGYVLSGDDYFENQIIMSAGIEYVPTDKWAFGLELNNRTFLYNSPMAAFRQGAYSWNYTSPSVIGDPRELVDEEIDWGDDYLWLTPSVRYKINEMFTINVGALVNLAEDQADPKETIQFNVGISINGALSLMIDSDGDGVKNNIDREPETPRGYPVDHYGVSLDTDGDGVPDGRDDEKNTPKGASVNGRGVGRDTDGDGVYDGIDREPSTPKGATVDNWGVGKDGDGDGVPDGIDREPSTPKGAIVDEWGVGKDGDSDGVPDGIDREPNTRRGAIVNELGVAKDGDGDGVPDGIDLEPDTPRGSTVDAFGRAIKEEEKKFLDEGVITVHKINFASGSSKITSDSYPTLRIVGNVFAKYPTLIIRIVGHTDNQGSRELNMRLSRERAQAVLNFLQEYRPELDPKRFVVEGAGPDKPIAANATSTGRAMNRRVEFVVINKEELKKLSP